MGDLKEERRKQLDGIVGQMVANKETDDDIQLVVNDFKQKYTAEAAPTPGGGVLDSVLDYHKGALKGAGSTLLGAYDLVRRNPLGFIAPPLAAVGEVAALAGKMPYIRPEPPASLRAMMEPSNTAQSLGKGVEQVAEFMIPGMGPAKGGRVTRALTEGGKAAGVAGVQSGGNPAEVAKAGLTAGVVSAAIPPTAKAAQALYESAKAQYARALRPTTKPMKRTVEKIIPELLERRVSGSLAGIEEKATAGFTAAGQQLDDALNAMAQNPNAPRIQTKPIVDALEAYKDGFIVQGVPINQRAVDTITGLQDTVKKLGKDVSFESMRRVRQILDEKVAWRKGFVMPLEEGSAIDATREAANAIRRELAVASPDIAKINKEYSFWKRVGDVTGETIERTTPQAPRLGERMMGAAGAAAGFAKGGLAGAGIGAATLRGMTKLLNSSTWNTVSAVNKARLADLIASGKFQDANSLMGRILAGTLTERKGISPPP